MFEVLYSKYVFHKTQRPKGLKFRQYNSLLLTHPKGVNSVHSMAQYLNPYSNHRQQLPDKAIYIPIYWAPLTQGFEQNSNFKSTKLKINKRSNGVYMGTEHPEFPIGPK